MPPKKDTNPEAPESGKLIWEGANDTKLLLLTQGRYVKPEEYEDLASAFTGATVGSIRNRISALRVKQRNMYEARNWTLPEGGAGHSAKKSKGGAKRSAGEEEGLETPTPSKKPRAPRKKKEALVREDSGADEETVRLVKEEPEEEEMEV